MDGVYFPATSVDLQVTATPSDDFDGCATATFEVSGAADGTTAEGAGAPLPACFSSEPSSRNNAIMSISIEHYFLSAFSWTISDSYDPWFGNRSSPQGESDGNDVRRHISFNVSEGHQTCLSAARLLWYG